MEAGSPKPVGSGPKAVGRVVGRVVGRNIFSAKAVGNRLSVETRYRLAASFGGWKAVIGPQHMLKFLAGWLETPAKQC